jgi:hypothetical protein
VVDELVSGGDTRSTADGDSSLESRGLVLVLGEGALNETKRQRERSASHSDRSGKSKMRANLERGLVSDLERVEVRRELSGLSTGTKAT